jgi:hypothetical protein
MLALSLLAATSHALRADTAEEAELSIPRHVYVATCLRKTVERMLQRSKTFRMQMADIARTPRVGIAIRLETPRNGRRADTQIRRCDTCVVLATISIRSVVDQAELVAHEIEHVREQIEGVPVVRLARAGRGAWANDGVYETTRAIRVGQVVRSEMMLGDVTAP